MGHHLGDLFLCTSHFRGGFFSEAHTQMDMSTQLKTGQLLLNLTARGSTKNVAPLRRLSWGSALGFERDTKSTASKIWGQLCQLIQPNPNGHSTRHRFTLIVKGDLQTQVLATRLSCAGRAIRGSEGIACQGSPVVSGAMVVVLATVVLVLGLGQTVQTKS